MESLFWDRTETVFLKPQKKVPKMSTKIPVKKKKLNLVEDKPNL